MELPSTQLINGGEIALGMLDAMLQDGINLKKEHMSINGNISTLLDFISTSSMPAPPEWYTTSDYGWQCFQYKIFLLNAKLKSIGRESSVMGACCKRTFFSFSIFAELYKMVCDSNETDLDINILAVMLSQDAGAILESNLKHGDVVSVQLYSLYHPLLDIAKVFLWLMAVGTILCASYWSAWSAREASIEHEKLLRDAPDELFGEEAMGVGGVVDINTTLTVLFVVIASCFLILLYKLILVCGAFGRPLLH